MLRTETSCSSGTVHLLTIFVDLDIEAKSMCRLCSRYLGGIGVSRLPWTNYQRETLSMVEFDSTPSRNTHISLPSGITVFGVADWVTKQANAA